MDTLGTSEFIGNQGMIGANMRVLTEAMREGGETARRAFGAMMTMQKIDHAAIEAAVRGDAA